MDTKSTQQLAAEKEDQVSVSVEDVERQQVDPLDQKLSDSEQYFVYGDGTDSAEAYSAISVTSALVFGFAVTTFVTVEAGDTFRGDSTNSGIRAGHVLFDILMTLTIVLSAYGLVVMNLQYYHVRRMRVMAPDNLRIFLKDTFFYRHVARGTTWTALALYLLGLLVFSCAVWNEEVGVAFILGLILGLGAVAVVGVWLRLNHKYMIASGKKK